MQAHHTFNNFLIPTIVEQLVVTFGQVLQRATVRHPRVALSFLVVAIKLAAAGFHHVLRFAG